MREFYTWLKAHCVPWADVLTWGYGLVSESITIATKGGPSHVRKVLFSVDRRMVVGAEMTEPCARYWTMYEIDPREIYGIVIGIHKDNKAVSPRRKRKALRWIERMVIQRLSYDEWELVAHLMNELGISSSDWSDKKKMVCSSFSAHIQQILGKPWTNSLPLYNKLVSPYDIRYDPDFIVLASLEREELEAMTGVSRQPSITT